MISRGIPEIQIKQYQIKIYFNKILIPYKCYNKNKAK